MEEMWVAQHRQPVDQSAAADRVRRALMAMSLIRMAIGLVPVTLLAFWFCFSASTCGASAGVWSASSSTSC